MLLKYVFWSNTVGFLLQTLQRILRQTSIVFPYKHEFRKGKPVYLPSVFFVIKHVNDKFQK